MVASASCCSGAPPPLEEAGALRFSSLVGPSASAMRTSGRKRNGQVAKVYHGKSGGVAGRREPMQCEEKAASVLH